MPLIHELWLRSVFYLYTSVDESTSGAHSGGTGFLVESPTHAQTYAVSCWRLVGLGNVRVARVNTNSGSVRVFDRLDWVQHPSGDDLAIAPVPEDNDLSAVDGRLLLGRAEPGSPAEEAANGVYGPGNEVFFIGRYGFHEGVGRNNPVVRFGNIAQMPDDEDPIWHTGLHINQESYVLEARSLGGFSGSPVFVNPQSFIDEGGAGTSIWREVVGQ